MSTKEEKLDLSKPSKGKDTSKRYLPAENEHKYRANLACLEKNLIRDLPKFPPKPIKIEDSIGITGLKNPICLVIIGFATRKVLEKAREGERKTKHIIVVEPDIGKFHQTIRREYIGDLLEDPFIDFVVGADPVDTGPILHKIFATSNDTIGSKLAWIQSPEVMNDPFAYPFVDGKPDPIVATIREEVFKTAKHCFIAMGCSSDSHFRWERFYQNKENIQNSYKISTLFNKFQNYPTVVVGAGPSCQDFIDAYKKFNLKDKCLIVAVDAVLRLLLENGIKPHLVTRCERKSTTIFDGVTKEMTEGIFYAAYPWTPPEYFDLFTDSFMLFRDNGLCRWSGYDPGMVNGGVSSGNAAMEIALLLGARDIVLTGIDCAFLGEKSHVSGTEVEFDVNKSKSKWSQVAGNKDGETVTTIPVWLRCLQEFEGSIFKFRDKGGAFRVYNTSLCGARINGTIVKGWEILCTLFSSDVYPLKKIQKHLEKHSIETKEAFEKKVKETCEFLKTSDKAMEKLFASTDDILTTAYREHRKVMNQMKSHTDPVEFFANVASIDGGLAKTFSDATRQIDAFRAHYFREDLFTWTLIDICQLDHFSTENKVNRLENAVKYKHERLRLYCNYFLQYFRTLQYYNLKLIKMFSGEKINDYCRDVSESPGEAPVARDDGEKCGCVRSKGSEDSDVLRGRPEFRLAPERPRTHKTM